MKNTIYSFITGCIAILWLYLIIPLLPLSLWLIDLNTIEMNKSCLMQFSKNTCDMYVYALVLLIPLPVYLAALSIYSLAISTLEIFFKCRLKLPAIIAGLASTILMPTALQIAFNNSDSYWLIQLITTAQFAIIFALSLILTRLLIIKIIPSKQFN